MTIRDYTQLYMTIHFSIRDYTQLYVTIRFSICTIRDYML
jgi:hypothetical protein